MVCRVFQKCTAAKRTQQPSSSLPSLDSPCDTTSLVNEFGDVDLPNANTNNHHHHINTSNSAIAFSTMNPSQIYTTASDHHSNNNVNTNMNLTMNWAAATTSDHVPSLPSLPWPSGLLNPNLSVNSLLLKALQLKTCQQREAAAAAATAATTTTDHFAPYIQNPGVSVVMGADHLSSNLRLGASSSSKLLECMPHQQHQQQEQPFNLDSIW